jgi:hypothetical protein
MVNRVSIILFCTFSCFLNTFGQTEKVVFPIGTYHSKATKIVGISVGLWEKNIFKDTAISSTETIGLRLEAPGFGWVAMLFGGSPTSKKEAEHQERLKKRPKFSETVNGISISALGVVGYMKINGISINGQCGLIEEGNGLMVSPLINISETYRGVMIGMFVNDVYEMKGIQLGGFFNEAVKFAGLQCSFRNTAKQLKGIQVGFYNESKKANGVQIAVLNKSENIRGVQIGLINRSKKTRGFQIGLLNKNEKRTFPFINWNFK